MGLWQRGVRHVRRGIRRRTDLGGGVYGVEKGIVRICVIVVKVHVLTIDSTSFFDTLPICNRSIYHRDRKKANK